MSGLVSAFILRQIMIDQPSYDRSAGAMPYSGPNLEVNDWYNLLAALTLMVYSDRLVPESKSKYTKNLEYISG